MMFIRVLLNSTDLLLKYSQQKKDRDRLLWLAASVVESKLCELCSCLLYIFPQMSQLRIDKDERSLVGIFPFSH